VVNIAAGPDNIGSHSLRTVGEFLTMIKDARLGDLPVEQPTRFELVVNLELAKALGITIPPSRLTRANEVIEP
jgi:putative tryptophan/tyrosine transport system substrate-binding protein